MSTQGSKPSGNLTEQTHAMEDAVEAALLLAMLGPAPEGDDDLLARHRLEAEYGHLSLLRRYTVGGEGPWGLSEEEARRLLGLEDLESGETVELFVDGAYLQTLLARLVDPEARVLSRAAAFAGVDEAELRQVLRRSGLDLEARTLNGHPWARMPVFTNREGPPLKVVETVTHPYSQMSLRDARLLDPSLEVGAKVRAPHAGEVLSFVLDELRPGALQPRQRYPPPALDVRYFELLRKLVPEVPTPASLQGLGLGPLHALYPEGYGVLYADVPGAEAERLWHTLDAQASRTGYRPVLLGGDEHQLQRMPLAWQQYFDEMPREVSPSYTAPMHEDPMDDPATVLAHAERLDVDALVAKARASKSDGGEEGEPSRVGTSLEAVLEPLSREPYARVRLALVPTDAAWKTLAHLPGLLQAGNFTPSLVKVTALSRRWEERHGARVASVRPGIVEWVMDRPVKDRDAALALAREQLTLKPSEMGTAAKEATALMQSTTWYLLWN
ncbi:DUF4253 domain-containing protein [Pyxidicoccus sp. 3LFB2]